MAEVELVQHTMLHTSAALPGCIKVCRLCMRRLCRQIGRSTRSTTETSQVLPTDKKQEQKIAVADAAGLLQVFCLRGGAFAWSFRQSTPGKKVAAWEKEAG